MKSVGLMILLIGAAGSAMAAAATSVPEIDSASAVGAVALLTGALLVIRARRKGREGRLEDLCSGRNGCRSMKAKLRLRGFWYPFNPVIISACPAAGLET